MFCDIISHLTSKYRNILVLGKLLDRTLTITIINATLLLSFLNSDTPLKVLAHNDYIGRIIGKQGNIINTIKKETDTSVTVSSINDMSMNVERVITVKGELESMIKALEIIHSKVKSAFENDTKTYGAQAIMMGGIPPIPLAPPAFASSAAAAAAYNAGPNSAARFAAAAAAAAAQAQQHGHIGMQNNNNNNYNNNRYPNRNNYRQNAGYYWNGITVKLRQI